MSNLRIAIFTKFFWLEGGAELATYLVVWKCL